MRKSLFAILFLAGFLLLPVANAASNQGLSWGVTEGQQFTFSVDSHAELSIMDLTMTTDEAYNILMEIQNVPEIPEDIDSLSDFAGLTVDVTFANGTDIGQITPIPIPGALALPIGNWTLMETLYEAYFGSPPGLTIINDASYFGIELSTSVGDESQDITFKLLKSDGFLYSIEMNLNMTMLGEMTYTMTRLGGLDTTMLLIIGGAAIAVLVIVIVLYKMRK